MTRNDVLPESGLPGQFALSNRNSYISQAAEKYEHTWVELFQIGEELFLIVLWR